MAKSKDATTMSVSEMRQLLGIKKTDSYWLLKKNCFETVIAAGQIRIVKASFEKWYARQDHYRKVSGEEPGIILHQDFLTVSDIAEILGISRASALDCIHAKKLPFLMSGQKILVNKGQFFEWLISQEHYRTKKCREKDAELMACSMSLPEMGRLIGIDRREAYKLAKHNRDQFEIVMIGDRKRITNDSFEKWYASQSDYVKVSERTATEEIACSKKDSYTLQEAAVLLEKDLREMYSLVVAGDLHGRKIGKSWRVSAEDLQEWIEKRRIDHGFDYRAE